MMITDFERLKFIIIIIVIIIIIIIIIIIYHCLTCNQ